MLLDPTVVNLNTGSFGPTPRPVFERAAELRRRLAAGPTDFLVRQAPPLLWRARERLADFLGADPRRLAFTANVSVSVNLVAASLRLAAPGEVLLPDHEYGAMHWCWERATQRQGLTLRTFALPVLAESPEEIADAFRRELSDRTRLLFFSHVLSPTGLVLPARAICAAARERGVLSVVDGAHAPAMIPLDVADVGCDFYCGNCHKWLLAPIGCGFLYFAPGHEDRLQPLQVSWGYRHDRTRPDEPDEFGSTPRLRALEFEGTRDVCAWLAVPEAIDFQAGLGWERARGRIAELSSYVRRRLDGVAGMRPATPANPSLRGALTAFLLPNSTDSAALRRRLWEHRIEAPVVERTEGMKRRGAVGGPGRPPFLDWHYLLRVSTHWYNTEEEIDRLAGVLEDFG
jgi:isopenicillin-N epimerase